jgi:phosphatidylserine/phosphatidylglycerophosphate/cardiolipin synthase-like enzyme
MTQTSTTADGADRDAIALAERVVPGGFFVDRRDPPARTPFAPVPDGDAEIRHCSTYAGGGSTIGTELMSILESATEKIFVATLYLGDAQVRKALLAAANRLRGGVYVISALDDKGLDQAINKVDDKTGIDDQIELRNFRELTRHGVYVRGYPGLHAKFVVVDDRVALVSSANLVTRSFERIGENGVVLTEPAAVTTLARLFGRLWQESRWEMPPDTEHYSVEETRGAGSRIKVSAPAGNGPVWTYADGGYTIAGALHDVIEHAEADLVLATFSISNMAQGLPRMVAQPELLFEPVRRALDRGVRVRMLLRARNHVRASRVEAAAFAEAGVEIYGDWLTHGKGVIADGRRGALFSANFETEHGLTGGVEVGMRLDGTPALAAALRYYEHVMAETDVEFVRDTRLDDLAERLDPEERYLNRWPLPRTVEVRTDDASWGRLAEQDGPALYERVAGRSITLYSGRYRWSLAPADGRPWTLTYPDGSGNARPAVEVLDGWLTARGKPAKTVRGLCPVTLVRAPAR